MKTPYEDFEETRYNTYVMEQRTLMRGSVSYWCIGEVWRKSRGFFTLSQGCKHRCRSNSGERMAPTKSDVTARPSIQWLTGAE